MSRCLQKTQELGSSSPSALNDSMDTVILPTSHNGLDTFRILASTRACAEEQGMKSGSPGEPPDSSPQGSILLLHFCPFLLSLLPAAGIRGRRSRPQIQRTAPTNKTPGLLQPCQNLGQKHRRCVCDKLSRNAGGQDTRSNLSDIPCATKGHTLPSRTFSDVLLWTTLPSHRHTCLQESVLVLFSISSFDLPTWERKGPGHLRIVGCPGL